MIIRSIFVLAAALTAQTAFADVPATDSTDSTDITAIPTPTPASVIDDSTDTTSAAGDDISTAPSQG